VRGDLSVRVRHLTKDLGKATGVVVSLEWTNG